MLGGTLLAADDGFVNLDDRASPTHRSKPASAHCLA
jgi:hypothetical protein